jgi:hypothetical protein
VQTAQPSSRFVPVLADLQLQRSAGCQDRLEACSLPVAAMSLTKADRVVCKLNLTSMRSSKA